MKSNERHQITNEVSDATKKSLKTRVITAIIGTAIVLPCLFIGGWTYFALICIAAAVGAWELVHCAKRKYNWSLYIVAIIVVEFFATFPIWQNLIELAMQGNNILTDFHHWNGFDTIYVSASLLLLGIILCFSMVLIDKNFQVHDAAYIFSFGVILGLGMQCLLFLRYLPMFEAYDPSFMSNIAPIEHTVLFDRCQSASLLLLVVGGSLMSDTGAYFAGILFGKHRMNERISPKKTWEGFVGGIILSMIFTLSLGYGMAAVGNPIISILKLDNWYFLLVIAIIIPLVSPLGDFIFSSVKRYYNIKDFGSILPGHGGVLDRVDSVLFSAVATSVLIILFTCIETQNWEMILL